MRIEMCDVSIDDGAVVLSMRDRNVVTHTTEYAAYIALCEGDAEYYMHQLHDMPRPERSGLRRSVLGNFVARDVVAG